MNSTASLRPAANSLTPMIIAPSLSAIYILTALISLLRFDFAYYSQSPLLPISNPKSQQNKVGDKEEKQLLAGSFHKEPSKLCSATRIQYSLIIITLFVTAAWFYVTLYPSHILTRGTPTFAYSGNWGIEDPRWGQSEDRLNQATEQLRGAEGELLDTARSRYRCILISIGFCVLNFIVLLRGVKFAKDVEAGKELMACDKTASKERVGYEKLMKRWQKDVMSACWLMVWALGTGLIGEMCNDVERYERRFWNALEAFVLLGQKGPGVDVEWMRT